jgi:hypothetical protein
MYIPFNIAVKCNSQMFVRIVIGIILPLNVILNFGISVFENSIISALPFMMQKVISRSTLE